MAVCEKRSLEETVHNAKNVLLDIEGTTTSISFVKDTLFPYVRKSLESYVTANWDKDEFKEVLTLLREQATSDVDAKVEGVVAIPSEGSADEQQAAVVSNILWQMDNDRKTTALKQLQGLVWRLGYKDGELKGHVYPDVAPALRRWTESGRKLYVYSSGSVEAQKLLFKYSQDGDLSELFSGHFDTTVGPKVEADSYKTIVKSLDCKPDNVIFLTDVPKEANAAREAGLPVVLVTREDAEKLSADEKGDFSSVSTLEDILFSASSNKRQKVDDSEADAVSEKAKGEKAPEEKMDVEEEKEKTEVADKEEPKTEVAEKMEEETAKTASEEKVTETKKESVEKMEDDSETKVDEKKPVEVVEEAKPVKESAKPEVVKESEKPVKESEKPVKESEKPVKESEKPVKESEKPVKETEKPVKETEKPVKESEKPVKESEKPVKESEKPVKESEKPVKESEKPVKESEKPVKESEKPVKESEKPVKESEKPVKESEKPVKESEKPVKESAKPSEESPETETVKAKEVKETKTPVEKEKVEKSEDKEVEKEAKPVSTKEKVEESKTEDVKEVKSEEPKVEEKKSDEKVEEKAVEKAEEAVEDKAEEVEKAVEAKEDAEESKSEETAVKQTCKENGAAVNGVINGKSEETSNGKTEENGVNGKEAHAEEVVVKKAAAATPAEAEVAAEA